MTWGNKFELFVIEKIMMKNSNNGIGNNNVLDSNLNNVDSNIDHANHVDPNFNSTLYLEGVKNS